MKQRVIVWVGVALVAISTVLVAQTQQAPPQTQKPTEAAKPVEVEPESKPLTETQARDLQLALTTIELWTERVERAQENVARAQADAGRLVREMCGEGWTINLQTRACVKAK